MDASVQMIADYVYSNPEACAGARMIGQGFGQELAGRIPASPASLDQVIEELSAGWSRSKIGEMRWENRREMLLRIEKDSYSTAFRADNGHMLCAFMEGLLEAVLEMKAGGMFEVREEECGIARGQGCIFRIRNY